MTLLHSSPSHAPARPRGPRSKPGRIVVAVPMHLLYFGCDCCIVTRAWQNLAAGKPTNLTAVPWTAGRTGRVLRLIFLFVAVLIVVDALVGDRGLLAALDARQQARRTRRRRRAPAGRERPPRRGSASD